MTGSAMFARVENILRTIFGINEKRKNMMFGGISVVVFGDMGGQLPAVGV